MTVPTVTSDIPHPKLPEARLEGDATPIARAAAIASFIADARTIVSRAPLSRETLDQLSERLMVLAENRSLFPSHDFPPPNPQSGDTSVRYRLNPAWPDSAPIDNSQAADNEIALYLNSLLPGKTTIPHNHDTWAVIVAIEGEELNRVYRRIDDGLDPGYAKLVQEKEVLVRPGTPIAFLPDEIHSIHVEGNTPTLHFHLYGRPLETLIGRIGIEPLTGKIVRYNQTHGTRATQTAG